MFDQARCGIGGHQTTMACSKPMSKRKPPEQDSPAELPCPRRRRARWRRRRAIVPPLRLRPALDRQPLVRNRWRAIRQGFVVRNRSSSPPGKKAGGVLTLMVEGAHAPLIQHLTPMIVERVNRFFGYAAINRIVFRQGKPPAPAPAAATAAAAAPYQRNLVTGCARSPIPSFATAWSCLPRKLPLRAARRRSRPRAANPYPSSTGANELMKLRTLMAGAHGCPGACGVQQEQQQPGAPCSEQHGNDHPGESAARRHLGRRRECDFRKAI